MRSRVDRAPVLSPFTCAALAACVLFAGCVSAPTGGTPERAERPARAESVPARAEPAPNRGETAAAPAPSSPLEAILSERRRGDYPEITADETGFTITEQVRIDGDARTEYEQALALLRQERYAEGIPLLVRVTETAPELTAPYVDLGVAYGRSGDLERAVAALETAKALSPEHPIVHNELGILYRKAGRFREARASYETALTVYSDFHYARRNLAVLCDLYLTDLECALEHYTAYMESVVDDAEVEIWIADIRNRLGL